MKFNERLKNVRKRAHVTQKSISDYLGVTLRTYQRYEEGTIEPPLSTVSAISQYFDLPVDCLLCNGFFANWEDLLLHRDELLTYLQEQVFTFPDSFSPSTISDSLLARLLSALFSEITFDGCTINVLPLVPPDLFPISIHADGP